MKGRFIITIGREFGSGGHEIGIELAKAFGVKCYDKQLIEIAAKESGLSEEVMKAQDESRSNSLIYTLAMDSYSYGYPAGIYTETPLNEKVFNAQQDVIKEIAARESCVIIGRCADYTLEDDPDLINVFIHAPIEKRIARVKRIYELDEKKAEKLIRKTDKKRANYYNFYTERKWGDANTYDLCFDSSKLGLNKAVELIQMYAMIRRKDV